MYSSVYFFTFLLFFQLTFVNALPKDADVFTLNNDIPFLLKADSCLSKLNYPCALRNYEAALEIVNERSDKLKAVEIINKIADLKYQTGKFNAAYQLYNEALNISREEEFKREEAKSLEGLSHVLWRTGDNINSISSIIESIKISTQLNDTSSLISASNILAGIYLSVGKIKDAERLYEEMLTLAITAKDSIKIADSYEYIGVAHFFREDYQNAISYYQKALQINLLINEELKAGINYGNIGEAHNKLKKYHQALLYYKEALEIQHNFEFNSGIIFLYYSIGETYSFLREFDNASYYYLKSLDLMKSTGEVREKQYVYKLLAENYSKQKNFEKAYFYHQQYAQHKDSIFNIDKINQLEEIKAKYELESKELENYYLTQENQLKQQELEVKAATIRRHYILGTFLFIFLGISIYLSFKLFKNKDLLDKANKAKSRLFAFIAHDLKGPIGNIKALTDLISYNSLQGNNNKLENDQLISHLKTSAEDVSTLVNNLLAWSLTQQNGFSFSPQKVNLFEAVDQNIALFNYHILYKDLEIINDIPESIFVYADETAILTIIRNILSNAIKFTPKKGRISLQAKILDTEEKQKYSFVHLSISDNGIGLSQEKIDLLLAEDRLVSSPGTENEKGSGIGFNLIKDFVKKSQGEILVIRNPDRGITVSIKIPQFQL